MDKGTFRMLALVVHAVAQETHCQVNVEKLLSGIGAREIGNDVLPPHRDLQTLPLDDWQKIVAKISRLFPKFYPPSPLRRAFATVKVKKIAQIIHHHLHCCSQCRAEVLIYGDLLYPHRLCTIFDPPLLLTLMGDTSLLQRQKVAIVGSRRASSRGLRESFQLGQIITDRGYVVVSGGAFGCDIAAHRGVLATPISPVPAIVVFAGGFSNLHPRGNAGVFQELLNRGALFITERLWPRAARPSDFPLRNRIISGLCTTLIIMEAGERSGAILTAGIGLDQGRDVWVLRHPEEDVRAQGSNRLIAEGANFFTTAQEWGR